MTERDLYMSWLNDAYAMEKHVEEVLGDQVKQAKEFPEIQGRIQQHLDVTRSQAERVKGCIERNGGHVSTLKSGMANVMGSVMGAGAGMAKDTLIKNVLTDIGTEHFEMASYAALVDAANALGDQQTATVCQEIYREEESMANWLHQELPVVSQISLQQGSR